MPTKKDISSASKKAPKKRKTIVHSAPLTAETEAVAKKSKLRTYWYAVGRRKSSVARVRLHKKGDPQILINQKPYQEYFNSFILQKLLEAPLSHVELLGKVSITVKVHGGGIRGQAESVRHGIARTLLLLNPESRTVLKRAGFLKRDARVKERKKYGLKRARRAPQWSKR